MELRFYENKGGYLVEGLEVVFPPPSFKNATFVISRSNGQVVSKVPLRLETPLASYTAFGMFLPNVPTQTDWQFFRHEFHFPAEPKVRWMTLADLTKRDDEYTVVAKVNGKPFKSYTAQVSGGQLQRHPRSRMDIEPHTAFISPRQVDTSSRTSSRYSMRDVYWVRKD